MTRSYKVVRGTLDFSGVVGRVTARSKYGGVCYLTCSTVSVYQQLFQQNDPSNNDQHAVFFRSIAECYPILIAIGLHVHYSEYYSKLKRDMLPSDSKRVSWVYEAG